MRSLQYRGRSQISGETVVPLGFGAGIDDAGVFQALLREGLIDLVRPDIGIFGISGASRVAALAEPYYVAVAPRHDGGPVAHRRGNSHRGQHSEFLHPARAVPAAEEDRAMRREIVSPHLEAARVDFSS